MKKPKHVAAMIHWIILHIVKVVLDWKPVYILLITANTTGLLHQEMRINNSWCSWIRASLYNSHKNPTRCNNILTFFISYLYEAQHVSGDTAHHQEPKTALAASGFACVEGCWTCSCWMLWGRVRDSVQQLHVYQSSMHAKPEAASRVLGSWWWAVCRLKHDELYINMK
jgi:hypothetical protein